MYMHAHKRRSVDLLLCMLSAKHRISVSELTLYRSPTHKHPKESHDDYVRKMRLQSEYKERNLIRADRVRRRKFSSIVWPTRNRTNTSFSIPLETSDISRTTSAMCCGVGPILRRNINSYLRRCSYKVAASRITVAVISSEISVTHWRKNPGRHYRASPNGTRARFIHHESHHRFEEIHGGGDS